MSIGEHPEPCPLFHLLTRSVYAELLGRQLSITAISITGLVAFFCSV